MPKEVIYGSVNKLDVHVLWGNSMSETVQLAVIAAERDENTPGTQLIIDIVNQWLDSAGMDKLDLADITQRIQDRTPKGETAYMPLFDGFYSTLGDWKSVNDLLKILKRARDGAFGRPE